MRIDKFIWAIRLKKTRSLASQDCNSEKVKLNGLFVKPSKLVNIGDQIEIKQIPIWLSYKVLDIPKSRVGAKLVQDFIINLTTEEDLEILAQVQYHNRQNKMLGIKGRPTKKDRRDLDGLKGN